MSYWIGLVVGAVGGTGAIVLAVGWFGRRAINAWLAKDLEDHKAKLAAENQRSTMELSHSFQLAAKEHAVRTEQLQTKRAEVLAELYKRLAVAARTVEGYVSPAQWVGEPSKDEKAKDVNRSLYEMAIYLDENKIFLPAAICDEVDAFFKEIRGMAISFSVYRPHDLDNAPEHHRKEALTLWGNLGEKMRTGVPVVRKRLEDELRKLIEASPEP